MLSSAVTSCRPISGLSWTSAGSPRAEPAVLCPATNRRPVGGTSEGELTGEVLVHRTRDGRARAGDPHGAVGVGKPARAASDRANAGEAEQAVLVRDIVVEALRSLEEVTLRRHQREAAGALGRHRGEIDA